MARIRRNDPCPCGSGKKYKKCCGSPVRFIMPDGVDGVERPKSLPVEETVNEFVKDFGGELVSELIPPNPKLPPNADYFFSTGNVVAELKSFEKDLFNSKEDIERIGRIIRKHRDSEAVSGYRGFRWAIGQERIPAEYLRDMRSLARRQIEHSIRQANKQIRSTKAVLGVPDARGLVLLVNDGNYFAHPIEAMYFISQVMREHFLESSIDGFVYLTVNVVAKVPGNDRELNFWLPGYRDEPGDLVDFVNRLGAAWGAFYARKIGQEVPHFQTDDFRVVGPMRLFRTKKPK